MTEPSKDTTAPAVVMSVNQVEFTYNANAGCPVVHMFGRDINGKSTRIDAEGFLPYFYVPVDEATRSDPKRTIVDLYTNYVTIKGTPVRKVFVPKPNDIREVRHGYTHFEADINLGQRLMIDCGIYGGVESPGDRAHYTTLKNSDILTPIRTCMVDIECNDERGFPKAEKDEIICITCWDSFTDVYTSFIYKPYDGVSIDSCTPPEPLESGCFKAQHHIIVNYNDEREMMKGFVAFIKSLDPDVLSGWNFTGFDMPYINGRLQALGIPVEGLGRVWGRTSPERIKGRIVFDLLMGYKKLQRAALPSYRLDAVAEVELGEKKVRYTGTLCDLWKKTPDKLLEYNYKDVQLCVGIDKKNHVIDFYREIARYVGCPLDRTLASSQVIDTYILRKAYGKYILPSRDEAAVSEMFEGATVLTPSKGLRENVVVFDLKSLYPMIMMTINASIETKDPKGEITAPNGVHFKKEPDGLTRSLIMDLLTQRDEKKRIRNTFPHGSDEYHLYDTQQEVLKVIMNTYYGVSGFPKFRLYDREIGSAVTATGRAIIDYTKNLMEEMGHKVVYGDSVAGDSRVIVNGIEREIKDLFTTIDHTSPDGKEYCDITGCTTDTLSDDGVIVSRKILYIMRHKINKKMYRITLNNRSHIDTTEDHSIFCYHNRIYSRNLKFKNIYMDSPNHIQKFDDVVIRSKVLKLHNKFTTSYVVDIKEIQYDNYVYDIEVEDTHRFFANGILVHNTDSVICELGVKSTDLDDLIIKSKIIEKILNKSYDKFASDTLHTDKHYFTTKFEKVYRRFFQAGKKKRYAGHLVWKEGVIADKIDIVGFETKRSDTPVIAKKVLQDIIVMLLEGKDHAAVKAYIKEVIRNYRKGKYSLEEIGIPSGITKEFADYKNNDIRVRSAKYSNANLNTDFKMGSKPKRVYIKSIKGRKYPPTDVLSFEFSDQVPPEFDIDYELMLNKTLRDPIVRMVDSLGWTWESIDPTMSTLEMFGIG